MIQIITRSAFIDAFRLCRPSNFSTGALDVLFDYLEELEEGCGEPIELDVIALCCDYTENSPEDIAAEYDVDIEGLDEEEVAEAVIDYLNDNTIVCGITAHGSIVYCSAF